MKLQSAVGLIVIFYVAELAGTASGLCLITNGLFTHEDYRYQCFRSSNDYLTDLRKAPFDVPVLYFTQSKITLLRDKSFDRFKANLKIIAYLRCGIEDVEDNAFQGLKKLERLGLMGNKLQVIKNAWFEGLTNLKAALFMGNRIKHVDDAFFSALPPNLQILDISGNRLTNLPTKSFENLKLKTFSFARNPFTLMSFVSTMELLKNTPSTHGDFVELDGDDPAYRFAVTCASKIPKIQLNEEFLKSCVEEEERGFLLNEKNYTVKQLCQSLKGRPLSPFLNCDAEI